MLDVVLLESIINESGMTQKQVAKAIGVKESNLSQKLSGQRSFKIREVFALADLFNLSLLDLKKIWGANDVS